MNEFESLEKDLKALTPQSPSPQLTDLIEEGFRDDGNLAIRRLPEQTKSGTIPQKSYLSIFPWLGVGMAASLVITALSIYFLKSRENQNFTTPSVILPTPQVVLNEDPESPIHGVSIAELESQSGMPVGGWLPTFQENFSTVSMKASFPCPEVCLPVR